jgi:predicted AAA+ superfamily ATPase
MGFFDWNFGLSKFPSEPGIMLVRGPRQYGKSTWREFQLRETLKECGRRYLA